MKKYEIDIQVKLAICVIALIKDGKVLDEVELRNKRNLSQTLLKTIDASLLKHKIEIRDLKGVNVKSEKNAQSSTRIAGIVSKVANFCLDSQK